MKKLLLLAAVALAALAGRAHAADYAIDKAHTSIGFSVKHMVISNVKGNFGDFTGAFTFDEKGKTLTAANAVIKAASINTDVADRDKHLRSPEFLDVEKYPEITFTLKKAQTAGDKIRATGDITIHGVTKEIALEGEFLGSVKDPWGNQRAGFTAAGKISRKDFGLTWNKLLESGGVVVGDEVKLSLEMEGVQKK